MTSPPPSPVPPGSAHTRAPVRPDPRTPVGPDDAPPRRSGKGCGYEHRETLLAANLALGKALSALARDRDPVARRAGADIAEALAGLVSEAAALAVASSSRSQRHAAHVRESLPCIERRLDAARARVAARGVDLGGPEGVTRP